MVETFESRVMLTGTDFDAALRAYHAAADAANAVYIAAMTTAVNQGNRTFTQVPIRTFSRSPSSRPADEFSDRLPAKAESHGRR